MQSAITIEIPYEIIHTARMRPDELKCELAVSLFQQGKISFGKARELAGMNLWKFQQVLADRNIPVHYDENDYEEDLENLREIGRL
jgi:predicted HTH domain antitoxin